MFCPWKGMLIVLNHLPVFRIPQHSFQEELFHDFPEHSGEADCSVVPRIFLSSFFKNWSDISYFTVTGDFTSLPWCQIRWRMAFGYNIIQFPLDHGMHLIGLQRLTHVQVHQVISDPIFMYSGRNLLSHFLPWCAEAWEKKKREILVQLFKFLSLFSVLLPDRPSRIGP